MRLELTSSVSLSLRTLDGLCCLFHQWGIVVSKLSERLCGCCRIPSSRLRCISHLWVVPTLSNSVIAINVNMSKNVSFSLYSFLVCAPRFDRTAIFQRWRTLGYFCDRCRISSSADEKHLSSVTDLNFSVFKPYIMVGFSSLLITVIDIISIGALIIFKVSVSTV